MTPPRQTYGPVISLLTDFGTTDPFVGVMHGVIYSRAPQAKIIDLTHAIPPQDIQRAGYVLLDSWRYFPPGTIHVAVVDPGVGTERRILAFLVDDQVVLAPDNGLVTALLDQYAPHEVRHLANPDLFLKSISQTFHGRDKFAPAAGLMAAGLAREDFGATTDTWITIDLPQVVTQDDGSVTGTIIYTDRFGNLITNMRGTELPLRPRVTVAGRVIEGLSKSFEEAGRSELLAIVGSTGRLEIAVNRGSAAKMLGASVGEPVVAQTSLAE